MMGLKARSGEWRRGFVSARAVGAFVPGLTRQAFERYGFCAATLVTDWPTIVGADIARWTRPERLKWPRGVDKAEEAGEESHGRPGAMLILAVDATRALDVQYRARHIADRINAYFGYRAVADIRILQKALEKAPSLQPVAPDKLDAARALVASLPDDPLKAALERLGAGILTKA